MKRVQFNQDEVTQTEWTWHPEDYDRTSIEVSPLTKKDVHDLVQYRIAMMRLNALLQNIRDQQDRIVALRQSSVASDAQGALNASDDINDILSMQSLAIHEEPVPQPAFYFPVAGPSQQHPFSKPPRFDTGNYLADPAHLPYWIPTHFDPHFAFDHPQPL